MLPTRVLVVDDDAVSRTVVAAMLRRNGFQVELASDGESAWARLQQDSAPHLVVMDWMMPGLDGLEICRRLRKLDTQTPTYVLLLTSRDASADIVEGLRAGADDYVTKPPDEDELVARVTVGVRMVALQQTLADRVRRLEEALSNVKQLQGLLPICSYCKRIRDDQNYWQQVESYISVHSGVQFSHSFCPDCYEKYVKPQLDEMDGGNSAPVMTAPPALDPRVLESLRRLNHEGEPDVLTEVLGLFLADGPARLEAIAGAVSAADGQALLRRAHGLKGAASTIGASALAAACRDLEEMGEKGEFASADGALHVMRRSTRVEQVISGLVRPQ